jgi:hypothetical protein
VVLHPQCPGCPLAPSEWEGPGRVGHKLTCKHLAPGVQTQPWKRVPFEMFVSEAWADPFFHKVSRTPRVSWCPRTVFGMASFPN